MNDRPSSPANYGALLRESLAAIESMQAEVDRLRQQLATRRESAQPDPIALIGAGCRFPGGVRDLDAYWKLLEEGGNAVTPIPPERKLLGGWETGADPKSGNPWYAGWLDRIDEFDPKFFGISAREAVSMDPQQRMALEVGWEALENAGYAPGKLIGAPAGVFVGLSTTDYAQLIHDSGAPPDVYIATGNAHNAVAGRLSFLLGLQGPSMAIDTACSSSLVAVHLACQSLRNGECRVALAGGVNVLLSERPFRCFADWGMVAPDGRCKTFDAAANGFVRSEGCGMLVLKRLQDALADGDSVLAVIRGSAVNQDGRSSGLTVPNGPAQEAVIRKALETAGVAPARVGYVEAHGTGTSLGDPIEAQALGAVYGPDRAPDAPLVVGSVKTNLGHLESAAGVAGLLKVVLSLRHERIPAHLHFSTLNPNIDWQGAPVVVPSAGMPWRRGGAGPRVGCVSSFGFSGTNAHIVIEEAPEPAAPGAAERPRHLFCLSARTPEALDALAGRVAARLQSEPPRLADAAFTASAGRSYFRERLAVVARDSSELAARLADRNWIRRGAAKGKLAFLFTGQGSQWAGMGRELYDTLPVFRAAMDDCARRLELDRPLLDVVFGDAALLEQTAYTQPALFAMEWSLAQVWKSWGIEPEAVLGHSVGEYAALCAAGVWSLEDGLQLIAARGRLMQQLGPGWGMSAVMAPASAVEAVLGEFEPFVSIAARNAPSSTVISGRLTELAAVEKRLAAAGKRTLRLAVSHGFHSAQMESMADEFARRAQAMTFREPRCQVVSSVTGQFTSLAELKSADYWRRQVRQGVEFQAGMETFAAAGYRVFLEVGPAPVLCGLGRQCVPGDGQLWAPSLRRERGAWEQILESLGHLYVHGAEVNWQEYNAPFPARRIALPAYPFERQRYWIEPGQRRQAASSHPLLGARIAVAGEAGVATWQSEIGTDTAPFLADHRVQDAIVVPATAYVEMAMAAHGAMHGEAPVAVSGVRFLKPLILQAGKRVVVQLRLSADGAFRIHSSPAGSEQWTLHAQGSIAQAEAAGDAPPRPAPPSGGAREWSRAEFYSMFEGLGNQWGPAFQGVQQAAVTDSEGWSTIEIPAAIAGEVSQYRCHPAVADACGHVLGAITAGRAANGAFVGQSIGRVTLYRRPEGKRLSTYARVTPTSDPRVLCGDVRVYDESGQVVSDLSGAELRYLDADAEGAPESLYQVNWQEIPFAEAEGGRADWVILEGRRPGLAQALARRIRGDGGKCTLAGEAGESTVATHPSAAICDLRGVDAADPYAAAAGLLGLIQAMAKSSRGHLWVVTSGAQAVGDDPTPVAFRQAPLWGLGRTTAAEHAEIWGGLVDLDPACSDEENARALWLRLQAPDREDQVAVRGGKLFAPRLERYRPAAAAPPAFRPDATYAITGGWGGLGLEVARWMAQRGARRLLLLGRSAPPERRQWRDLPAADPFHARIERIRELERAGVSVHLASVDLADPDRVRAFFDSFAAEGWPEIRGVVHAAGVLEHAALADLTAEQLARVMRPKVAAHYLAEALRDAPLDFFVMFSSASSLLNSPELGAYAAANCLLDALAHDRAAQGKPALTINWGLWSEAGMALRFTENQVRGLSERGMGAIPTEQGLENLERLMSQSRPQAAAIPVVWRKWASLYPDYAAAPMIAPLCGVVDRPEPDAAALPAAPEDTLAYLTRSLAAVLGFNAAELDPNTPITDLGLDSITAVEFRNRITDAFRVRLPLRTFFDAPTLAGLAEKVQTLALIQEPSQETPRESDDREEFVL
jgi:acyl transferase domain-containing protein/acyl carrier protein